MMDSSSFEVSLFLIEVMQSSFLSLLYTRCLTIYLCSVSDLGQGFFRFCIFLERYEDSIKNQRGI